MTANYGVGERTQAENTPQPNFFPACKTSDPKLANVRKCKAAGGTVVSCNELLGTCLGSG